ncbi:MAG: hypothetical protein WA659_03070 [Candidatus Aquirickettsiella sp.]
MKRIVAIFGYNNTRLYDVKKIKNILKKQQIDVMLCKEGITSEDKAVSQYCFDTKLHGTPEEIKQAYSCLESWVASQDIQIVGILPFSDKGVLLASYVAEKLDLISDDYITAVTGLDKFKFRTMEVTASTPVWYKKPKFQEVKQITDIIRFYSLLAAPVYVKPTQEGNSRGGFLVKSADDIENAFQNVEPYVSDGAIVEECAIDAREFSFDTIAGKCWITEKETTIGHYKAEIQQILPAPLTQKEYDKLIEAGRLVADISGSKGGAAHNELFLFSDATIMTVEPNRRPAGMHIWDMAEHAFANFKPFEIWINWAIGKQPVDSEVLEAQQYVGIRMIQASADGDIIEINSEDINAIKVGFNEIIEINISKKLNETVYANPRDNADFLGYIIAKHKDPDRLKGLLNSLCSRVGKAIKVKSLSEEKPDYRIIKKIREEAKKEKVITLDCSYMKPLIEEWWNKSNRDIKNIETKEQLKDLLIDKFKNEEQLKLSRIGVKEYYISAIFMVGLFSKDDPDLAYIVHEALSDLSQINDIKYLYEDHKKIFIKPEGFKIDDWGNGAGAISPHCDDLYEDTDTDLLSLTICRDKLKVSTLLFMADQIFKNLSDSEMDRLTKMIPLFSSGKNVKDIVIEKKRPVLSCKNNSFFMAFDYRVDENKGDRMRVEDEQDLAILRKIKTFLTSDNALRAESEVGNFVILSNTKVLHAREAINAVKELCTLDLDTTPRLLFRSKGPRL